MKKLLILFVVFFIGGVCWGVSRDVHRDTGSSAMSETYTKNAGGSRIVEVRLHLSAAASTSENFVVYIDSGEGTAYDTVLYTKDMSGVQDVVYRFSPPLWAAGSSDVYTFTYTNSDGRTWGLEAVFDAY